MQIVLCRPKREEYILVHKHLNKGDGDAWRIIGNSVKGKCSYLLFEMS